MDAAVESGDRTFGVLMMRGADMHDVGLDGLEQRAVVGEAGSSGRCFGLRPTAVVGVAYAHEFHAGVRRDRGEVNR
ncbi:hypothetical protein GCM10022200_26050 [Microbacterium awajiense]|uniref:Uncharacterized protein n=1 Tax=Microbacterium awajiense TaxID=415214 RepID=A0ABP7AVT3_9MICO